MTDASVHEEIRRVGRALFALVGLCMLVELIAILVINRGHFVYSLDDPYIHLNLSAHLFGGTYGVNAGESSSPCSSILWPFLLAPFAPLPVHEYMPLVFNVPCTLASMALLLRISRNTIVASPSRALSVTLLFAIALAANVPAIAFTGLEHSLQIFLALAVLYGLIVERETQRVTWWLAASIVVGPLVRYESLAITAGAVVALGMRRRFALAVGLFAGSLVGPVLFSNFLLHHGLPYLPSSVLLKSQLATQGSIVDIVLKIGQQFLDAFNPNGIGDGRSMPVCVVLVAIVCILVSARREKSSAVLVFGAIGGTLHCMAGTFGWFHRYEAYVTAVLLGVLVDAVGPTLITKLSAQRRPKVIVVLCVLGLWLDPVLVTLLTPLASNNIYEQQMQMRRFVVDYWKGPVGANDIGLVGYRNPDYVLDYWGLSSEEARKRLGIDHDPTAMKQMTDARHIKLAIVYKRVFRRLLPTEWTELAVMKFGRPSITPAFNEVSFMLTDPSAKADALEKISRFRTTLPSDVTLDLVNASH